MAKKKNSKNKTTGDQLDLIDVQPENAKPIMRAARLYKKCQIARIAALDEEVAQKQRVLELIEAANLQPLEGGVIRFQCDGMTISVTPRDKLLRVKDKEYEDD